MKVSVLDDYQHALVEAPAIQRLRQRTMDAGFHGFAENAVDNILDYMDGRLTRAVNPEALKRRRSAT